MNFLRFTFSYRHNKSYRLIEHLHEIKHRRNLHYNWLPFQLRVLLLDEQVVQELVSDQELTIASQVHSVAHTVHQYHHPIGKYASMYIFLLLMTTGVPL